MRELASSFTPAAAPTVISASLYSSPAASRGWWDDVNKSPQWQEGAFFSLATAYALVSAVALIQLIRIQHRVPKLRWTTQKIFHLMNFLVSGFRAVVFAFHAHVFLLRPRVYKLVLLDLPSLLFFSTYTLLVLFWAEIYHQVRSLPTDKLRPAYISINTIIYVVQLCIWIYLGIHDNAALELASKIFNVAVSCIALLGFSVYGGRVNFCLKRYPIESVGRQRRMPQVRTVTAICVTCFLIRCMWVALSAFVPDVSLEVLDHPILYFFFY
ncbi:hypothetical protein HU200_013420 [Digitaria exilis]|uniref:THH1/TOM1/TOM3 domain-containing protein n=1 Tax=Digitaria exilis TaxID=1010633 RepID=A0A835KL29_9POAL|nr:hypothetical protein HU200_013420 [Digitaria exilis]